ncbi:hypothetical protein [Shinella zoogloeoides]|uniref:thermonuclease family protein n=1 Tax=Shinella TaxID=323620 RepID=UPI0028B18A27|nr:hypothetical protein [Shinella zoogloeoides]
MAKKTTRRKKASGAKRSGARRGGGMAHWYVLGAALVGGILYMDNWTPGPEKGAAAIRTASIERREKKPARETALARAMPTPAERVEQTVPAAEKLPPFAGKWFICTTQTDYCVLDGSTILYAGRKVRLADIDAPSISDARCDAERSRGGDAKLRLREILNEGDISLVAARSRAAGKAGAAPHIVMRGGQSIGQRLVREGFARPWAGRHQSWCG